MRQSIIDFFNIDTTPKDPKSKLITYEVTGNSQTRANTLFIENEYTALVNYKDEIKEKVRIAVYQVEDYKQSCDGLIFRFTGKLNHITSDLELRLNERYEIEEIVNHKAILNKWQEEKNKLKTEFRTIPDSDVLFENYEKAIRDEERLRKTLFYNGLTQLFFPRIKQMLLDFDSSKKYKRKKVLAGDYFGLQIPIIEELSIQRVNNKISATIKGTLDKSNIQDEVEFMSIFKRLYGQEKTLNDLLFFSKEYYVFDEFLVFDSGSIEEYFEVKGVLFKKDNRSFIKKGKK